MKIPFVDLKTQYGNISDEIDAAIQSVIDECAFVGVGGNRYVRNFESAFAKWLGVDDFIACANGTDAIEILLKAAGIGPGDEVIVPALTWISTAEAVGSLGAIPVFADIEADGCTLDAAAVAAAITDRTRAVIPVHLYGQMADMDAILALADRHGLFVLEDCAQAHGARYKGRMAGTLGDAASFSFFPGKNLGAYGDAGGMTARDPDIARKARLISNHGQSRKHCHEMEGRNSRMDGLQAAILSVKLGYLDDWTEKRRAAADLYRAKLGGADDEPLLPVELPDRRHVYHLFVLRHSARDELATWLADAGIACGVHYPTPLPYLDAYRTHGFAPGRFPRAESACASILSIPIYPEITEAQISSVAGRILEFPERPGVVSTLS